MFELVNQKMFKMEFSKMAHLTFLVIYHLKVIVCQNFNLSHTYSYCLEKNHLWCDNYQTFHIAHKHIQIIWNQNISYNITNFIKIKIYLKHFLSMFAFLVIVMYLILCKYFLTSHHMKWKNVISLAFDLQ
jgi:hypothetical protein